MKNHFFFGYAGNKRQEVELIFDNYIIKKYHSILSQPNKIIIEPFCGTCALSYYLSLKYPKHFKYILNDNNIYLIELLNIAKDENKLKEFEKKINEVAQKLTTKEKYLEIIKQDNLIGYFISQKIYCIRAGLFPLDYVYKYINLVDCPIVNFLRTENIELNNEDALTIINRYSSNSSSFIFMDPPYLQTENSFYKSPTANIYQFMSCNPLYLYEGHFFLILENNWIIKLLFKDYKFIEYDKKYETSKKRTTHMLISSKPIYINDIGVCIDD
jgi:site-specific DNA-adenine methylase